MKTIGEQRVRIDFNVSGNGDVDIIKRLSADLINFCQDRMEDGSDQGNSERNELYKLAQRAYEEAAMWAVKAATAGPQETVKKFNDYTFYEFFENFKDKLPNGELKGDELYAAIKGMDKLGELKDVKKIHILTSPTIFDATNGMVMVQDYILGPEIEFFDEIDLYSIGLIGLSNPTMGEASTKVIIRCSPKSIKKIK